ncbi:hypothetical protein F5884DRAFT_670021 [Xylogone sp. PMI_703]|nr:hypothetical protein F5884DRAFT_670021 [Xylogone sp. PMI_703]
MDAPGSPVSTSTDSSAGMSSITTTTTTATVRQAQQERHSAPATPFSPPGRLTRKRAASQVESPEDIQSSSRYLNNASASANSGAEISLTADPTNGQVCLCQPEPKVPRPRNAFILYRQHYQAQVVAQNPGLANPEISKIIGEQWRAQPREVRETWGRLAEPRRAGKANAAALAASSSSDDPTRCPKCHGRYISTAPTPPLTATLTAAESSVPRSDRFQSSFMSSSPRRSSEIDRTQHSSQVQTLRLETPRALPYHPYRRPPCPPPLHTHRERSEDAYPASSSPELKRRRFNNEAQRLYLPPAPMPFPSPSNPRRGSQQVPPPAFAYPLPSPAAMARGAPMGTPPQQSPIYHSRSTPRAASFDESLRLPPLQGQSSKLHVSTSRRSESESDGDERRIKSMEAMIMTIPYINKIKLLSKISPPLASQGSESPSYETRGAIIAVEGSDASLVQQVGDFIHEHMTKDPNFAVRTWIDDQERAIESTNERPNNKKRVIEQSSSGFITQSNEEDDPFLNFLAAISEWHKCSRDIIRYITTKPEGGSVSPCSPVSQQDNTLPVALLPRGYSLCTSDYWALRIPINDSYSPVDHWQWMATLWRGIVGPDLTIFVTTAKEKEDFEKAGTVEIRSDCAAIIVRVADGGSIDEKTFRRLGFEVLEFVRGMETGSGNN